MKQSLLYPRMTSVRRAVSLDGLWKFSFDPESKGVEEKWAEGLKQSVNMPVPASFCDIFTDKDSREYCGDFWYETEFIVPKEWEDKNIVVRFSSVTHKARVFINGTEVCSHTGGFLPFDADITAHVKFNEMNRLSVLANNELSEVMIPCGSTAVRSDGKKISAPYFDFYNYAGIHRPVKLLALPKVSVTDYSTVYRLEEGRALVDFTVETEGEAAVSVCLMDKDGNCVAKAEGTSGTLEVADPRLWAPGHPYLYTIVIRLMNGDELLDEYTDRIGIRTFEVRDGNLLLNGKPIYLKGFGKHEDADIRGKGLDLSIAQRDYECMKWIGANCYRTSHYPYAEEWYYMADEEGFLIIDEVPAVGMFESLMNAVDASKGQQKPVTWFEKETTPQLLAHHIDCVHDMIVRDKNHPSVIAWSLLNEPETVHPTARPYFEQVFAKAHEFDPQKRPRTFALIMNSRPGVCNCWDLCDFVSLNRYYGWYVLGGPRIIDAEKAFRAEMDKWAEIRGDKPFVFTEYGADTNGELHKLPSVMWSQEYQDEYLDMTHRVFDSYPWIKGEMVWNFADFQTTEGIIRMNGNKKGIFTRDRQPKSAAFVFRNRWTKLPEDYKG